MGSHRYELFATKGIRCVECGIEGSYFALEKDITDSTSKFHLNLYGKDEKGDEVMITKDHILPKSKGGENRLSNYQPMCYKCNQKKADKII
jgi:5-methylcytosine-specific restriction endonuclease McrA